MVPVRRALPADRQGPQPVDYPARWQPPSLRTRGHWQQVAALEEDWSMAAPVQRRRHGTRRELGFLVIGMLLGVVAFPLGVIASHQFSDVPDSNTYHADIDALADAGVTTGCGDGTTFCPSAFVTREQMAAFMNRLGALAAGKNPVVNADKLDGLDSSDFLQSETATSHYSCHASGMFAVENSGATYSTAFGRSGTSSGGTFGCPLILPDGATITALRGYVRDASGTEYAGPCNITAITLATAAQSLLAATDPTAPAFSGGAVVLSDTSITNPVVDNETTAYVTMCGIIGTGSDITLTGIQVEYTHTGLPVH
jgi:hypothetical protein